MFLVVPELILASSLFQIVSLTQAQIPAHIFHQAASEMSVLLQQQGDAACRDLASAATAEVNAGVKSRQNILDSLPNGSQCENEGQQNIIEARNAKNVADAAVQAAQKAESDLRDQPFDLIGLTLAGLTEGNCDPFFQVRRVSETKICLAKCRHSNNEA